MQDGLWRPAHRFGDDEHPAAAFDRFCRRRERFGIAKLGLAAGLGGRVIEMAGDPDLRVWLGGDR